MCVCVCVLWYQLYYVLRRSHFTRAQARTRKRALSAHGHSRSLGAHRQTSSAECSFTLAARRAWSPSRVYLQRSKFAATTAHWKRRCNNSAVTTRCSNKCAATTAQRQRGGNAAQQQRRSENGAAKAPQRQRGGNAAQQQRRSNNGAAKTAQRNRRNDNVAQQQQISNTHDGFCALTLEFSVHAKSKYRVFTTVTGPTEKPKGMALV